MARPRNSAECQHNPTRPGQPSRRRRGRGARIPRAWASVGAHRNLPGPEISGHAAACSPLITHSSAPQPWCVTWGRLTRWAAHPRVGPRQRGSCGPRSEPVPQRTPMSRFHVSPIECRRVGGRSCSLLRVGDTRYLLNTNTLSGLLRATMAGEERGAFLLGKLCDRGREDGQPVDLHALRHVLPDLIPADRWTTARVTLLHVSRNRRARRFHLMRTIMV